jgi:NADPH2:quinone reductase
MKAIRIQKTGGPEVLEYLDIADLKPGENQLLVQVEAAGVNFIDTYHREGLYPVELPFTPGIEAAGLVLEVGSSVTGFKPGERVVYCLNIGSYAEQALVDPSKAVPLPDKVGLDEGVASMCQGMTAHYLTTDCYSVKPGDTALVHAAAGGVGLLLGQMVKLAGGQVVGTVSTEDKAQLALGAGADHVIRYVREDFEAEVTRLTQGEGVDVVYESVGKATFEKSLNCLKPRGYLVLFGQSSGPVGPFDPQILNQKGSLFITRPSLFHYAATRSEFGNRAESVLRMIENGQINITIGGRLELSEAAEAHRRLEGRMTTGKLILVP